jgi:hypothetical protein
VEDRQLVGAPTEVFLRHLYICHNKDCGRLEDNTALLVWDHIKQHRPILGIYR